MRRYKFLLVEYGAFYFSKERVVFKKCLKKFQNGLIKRKITKRFAKNDHTAFFYKATTDM